MLLSQMNIVPGNPRKNTETILVQIAQAKVDGQQTIVFPEMAVPGYLLGDRWENDAFLRDVMAKNEQIREATRGGLTAIWGSVMTDANQVGEDGRTRKYNAAYVAHDGEYVQTAAAMGATFKTLMPKYREFDDERHFLSLAKLALELGVSVESLIAPIDLIVDGVQRKVGIIICEDMWDADYPTKPVEILKAKGADLIVNISTSPYGRGKHVRREQISARHSEGIEFAYVNPVWVQDNGKNLFLFDGGTSLYRDGKLVTEAAHFATEILDTTRAKTVEKLSEMDEIHTALVTGIREFYARAGKTKAIIGLSGGIDSAVVVMLLVEALGAENVIAVNMPSKFNSDTTKDIARELAENLGIQYLVAPIQDAVELTVGEIESILGKKVEGLNLENIQSRDRGSRLLAAIASVENALFTNNGNKSEIALGYSTFYGDLCGALAPIGDLWKSDVYALAEYLIAKFPGVLPERIMTLVPSAELSDAQNVDQGKGDPFIYEYHDKLLRLMVEFRKDPQEILVLAQAGKLQSTIGSKQAPFGAAGYFATLGEWLTDVERIWKMLHASYAKRVQAPPLIAVSKRAFGFDLREAFATGVYFTDEYLAARQDILGQ